MRDTCIDHGRTKSLSHEGYWLVANPFKKPRTTRKHRLVYLEANNLHQDDIAGLCVRHKCDNPRCINPEHLEIGTWGDNNRDRVQRGRSAKVVPSRQKLTKEDVINIQNRFVKGTPPKRNPNGYSAIARDYGVDIKVIYNVIKGVYVCSA